MKIMKKLINLLLFVTLIISCNRPHDPNDMGTVEILPKGEYIIYNIGSRHIVKCIRPDGKYYWLNDANFSINNIPGYDAHQYIDKTRITIK